MKMICLYLCPCLLMATLAFSQGKKGTPTVGAASAAAKMCNEPFAVGDSADGWPEGPVNILFHHENSKAPWTHNPAIHVAGLEAATPTAARTIVCVEESRVEVGRYDSGEPGYAPSWSVILMRPSDGRAYFMQTGFNGEMPPGIKYKPGAGVGKPPTEIFVRWLRLLFDQKVARFKMLLKSKEYDAPSALAFSADDSRLVLAQAPHSSSSGLTPPSPITVFDLKTGQTVAAMHADYSTDALALSKSGSMVATERYGHVEIWDVATGAVTRKLETTKVTSLVFGPDDMLGVAGDEKAAVWDVSGNRIVHSGSGSVMTLSPEGAWLVTSRNHNRCTVRELESGQERGNFPCTSEIDKYTPSRDGRTMARSSLSGATIYPGGNAEGKHASVPKVGVDMLASIAATSDGFVIGNGNGIAGMVSFTAPEARAFATDMTTIKAIAVSQDGKLLALGDSNGHVEIWELR
jgi:WD40 repeat protein